MTTQELIDKLMKIPAELRESREVFIDATKNYGAYEVVDTVHVDRVGDVVINAAFILPGGEEIGHKL